MDIPRLNFAYLPAQIAKLLRLSSKVAPPGVFYS